MTKFTITRLTVAVITTLTLANSVWAANSPTYEAKVPQSVITPNEVSSNYLGELTFNDGFPSELTAQKTYDYLDTARAVELFINALPTASMYGMLNGHKEIGFEENKTVGITEQLMDARSLWLTPQTTTPYATTEVDLRNGPVVLDVQTPILGILDDAYFQYVSDIGITGPDKGKGGKYFIVGPDYEGEIPQGYHVVKSKTYRHWLIMRVFIKDGELEKSVADFKRGFKIYPYSNPEQKTEFVNLSGKQYNTIHAMDETIFDEINEVIQYEPEGSYDPEILGLAASIGIKKGQPFAPDARMKSILQEASKIGSSAARTTTYRPRNEALFFYSDRQWYSPLASGSYEFLDDGARAIDDRLAFHFYATGVTPAMTQPAIGKGSVYEIASTDQNGQRLDGGQHYAVTLPGPVPSANFWSFMVYDNQTRSILETDQKSGGVDSNSSVMKYNEDGSVTIHFSPNVPEGKEGNWVQTMPDKGYNVLLRIYGPEKAWFDKSWKPGDFVPVKYLQY
ncbi:DUF1254 domain-containing protein [Vibrio lamellibrachiae]|uniref:DUF1254 domain-containing protein n=1 Tax=Vibrio lamellibrachiae TaxID=2910253 RepID=UPI003D0D022C